MRHRFVIFCSIPVLLAGASATLKPLPRSDLQALWAGFEQVLWTYCEVVFAAIALVYTLSAPIVVSTLAWKADAVAGPAVAAPKAEGPTCPCRIRVVYAGYGEAQVIPCTVLVHDAPR